MKVLPILICMLVFGFQSEAVDSPDFSNTVSKWKESLKSSDFCSNQLTACQEQINDAVTKGNEQYSTNVDVKLAVEMINIYTSVEPETFKNTNAVLRKDPNKDVREKDDAMFEEYASILKKSIDILCKQFPNLCEKHSPVYRAQSRCISIACPTYTFSGFLSTSKEIQVAEGFFNDCSDSSILFRMTSVEGISIRNFSEVPEEEEILIKPQAQFKIIENLNSVKNESHLAEIERIINSFKGTKIPKAYVAGIMIGHRNKRAITSQQCPSTVRSNASTVIYGPKCVGTAIVILLVYMLQ